MVSKNTSGLNHFFVWIPTTKPFPTQKTVCKSPFLFRMDAYSSVAVAFEGPIRNQGDNPTSIIYFKSHRRNFTHLLQGVVFFCDKK